MSMEGGLCLREESKTYMVTNDLAFSKQNLISRPSFWRQEGLNVLSMFFGFAMRRIIFIFFERSSKNQRVWVRELMIVDVTRKG